MKVTINNKVCHLPESWNDVKPKKLVEITEILYGGGKLLTKKIKILLSLLDLHLSFLDVWKKDAGSHSFTAELMGLMAGIEFLFVKQGTNKVTQALTLTKNPFPKWRVSLTKNLYGPGDGLSNISFYEFTKADTFYIKYMETGDEIWLNKLVSVLYRSRKFPTVDNVRKNYGGDIRVDLIKFEHSNNLKIINKASKTRKLVIMHYFASCRKQITDHFENIFKKVDPTAGHEDVKRSGNDYGWAGVLLELAGTKFGDDDGTASKPLFTILVHLSMNEDKRKKQIMIAAERAAK